MRTAIDRITIAPSAAGRSVGYLRVAGLQTPCALGRNGRQRVKREGDGATPTGRLRLLQLLYRPDRLVRPATGLPVAPIAPDSGWCDDPRERRYNRPVRLPFGASHERLWRDDHLYDLLIVLNYNIAPVRPGAGSAIFFHLATADLAPTEGCVAIARAPMLTLLTRVDQRSYLEIG
jgi:L,D-peptidoglycan transpeptidase YkuD (ErfK/YbiS/YcfS/YnhG family)